MNENEVQPEVIVDELTYRIIGCAMKVHGTLGNGFPEVIYQRALEIELKGERIKFMREKAMPLYYRGNYIGNRRVDFLIENQVIVEMKAVIELKPAHLAQGLNYLEAFNVDRGLLINFGSQSLEVKRLRKPLKKGKGN